MSLQERERARQEPPTGHGMSLQERERARERTVRETDTVSTRERCGGRAGAHESGRSGAPRGVGSSLRLLRPWPLHVWAPHATWRLSSLCHSHAINARTTITTTITLYREGGDRSRRSERSMAGEERASRSSTRRHADADEPTLARTSRARDDAARCTDRGGASTRQRDGSARRDDRDGSGRPHDERSGTGSRQREDRERERSSRHSTRNRSHSQERSRRRSRSRSRQRP